MLDLSVAFATFPVFTTERLVMRQVVPDDAPAMFEIMSDPDVMRYFGSPPMASPEEAIERVTDIRAGFAERSSIRWAITRREDGRFLGTCGFWRLVKRHYRAEIGYELGRAWWGQGLMPEALAVALGFGFESMGLHSVEANIDPANRGSRRVLEKLGFVQEGYFRESYYEPHQGRFADAAVFSLLKGDWAVWAGD
jgi:ribosomal-protein-alanine N-acetyltransferase